MKTSFTFEPLSPENITSLIQLVVAFRDDTDYREEFEYYSMLIQSRDNDIHQRFA